MKKRDCTLNHTVPGCKKLKGVNMQSLTYNLSQLVCVCDFALLEVGLIVRLNFGCCADSEF